MQDAIGKHFGLLIAYVLPGFVALWSLRELVPAVNDWLTPAPTIPAGFDSVFFVTLAAVAAGMTVSAIRWALVDTLHHYTGLPRPTWDDANLPARVQAFDVVVEAHYRYYQHHSNMAVAVALLYLSAWLSSPGPSLAATAGFVLLETLFLATSRDNLRKYYGRTARLLGLLPPDEWSVDHVQRQPPQTVSRADHAGEGDQEGRDRVEAEVDPS